MSRKARVAIIGAGGIAGAHCKGYLTHADRIEVVALVDVDEANLEARKNQLGNDPRTYKDWKKMLAAEADEIDAVDICLPHHLHKAAIIDAARAGKHILCEKPLCMTLREADAIEKVLKETGVMYMSAHNQLFLPCVMEAKKMIGSGALGRIYYLKSQDCFLTNRTAESWGWRAKLKMQGGGELIDTGYHPTYRLLHLAGSKAVSVQGTFGRFWCDIEGEDTACVNLRFENGTIGQIVTSWAMALPYHSYQIHAVGEEGELFGSGSELFWKPKGYVEPARRTLPSVDTFVAEIGHFADCLLTGERPVHGFEEGREVLRVIVEAAKTAKGWEDTAQVK